MRTDLFLAAVRGVPSWLTRVDLLDRSRSVVYSTASSGAQRLTARSVRFTEDRSRAVTGDASVSLLSVAENGEPDPLVPTSGHSILAPTSGALVRVTVGVRLPDGTEEWAPPLFTQALEDTDVREDASGVTIDLTTVALEQRLAEARFAAPLNGVRGSDPADLIVDLVQDAIPGCPVDVPPTGHRLPATMFDAETDRLEAIIRLATSIGRDIWFDEWGTFVCAPTSPSGDATMRLEPGDQVTVRASNRLTRAEVYNGAVCSSQTFAIKSDTETGAPWRAEAWDLDESSPTYYDPDLPEASTFGPKPIFHVSEFYGSDAQCLAAAEALVAQKRGLAQHVSLSLRANPLVRCGDRLDVALARVGITGLLSVVRRSATFGEGMDGLMEIDADERRL